MKKILCSIVLAVTFLFSQAQDIDKATAMQLILKNSAAVGLNEKELVNTIVYRAYFNRISNGEMIYLQQSYLGVPVFNKLYVLSFKNGKLVSKAGDFVKNIEKKVDMAASAPAVSAQTAVLKAMHEKKVPSAILQEKGNSNNGQKIDFGKPAGVTENITAELMWVPVADGKSVRLAWQVYLVPKTSSDYWLVRVDANSNLVLDESNLTVYCNWDNPAHLLMPGHQHTAKTAQNISLLNIKAEKQDAPYANSPLIVNGATYRVIPFPAESPNHPGGAPALVQDPWTRAPGNATSLKWHSNGTTDYNITRGNNVWAKEDRGGNNNVNGTPATSSSPDPLTFDFTPDFTVAPAQTTPVQNQQFNTTNLFYWNNLIHDITYQYGFDEASANFQTNNQGRGGVGNDHVLADAQDGAGTNNANFATPADGGSGRMQMYLWNGSPQKDGDVDNGIIVHEYGHGISNRLTGGGSGSCLGSAEQMGEGWSDFYGLMYTQDWANSVLTDGFNKPRGIGTYVFGQPNTGLGIRSQRYCTNFAVNNKVYAATIPAANLPHDRGEIWCATLWDMTWNIINQVGAINPNIFDANAVGGNSIALKLVTQGLKLQPCGPGFIDGRDGILAADQLLYNGQYRCAIMAAFARRGMGFGASQGSANSTTDQTPSFSIEEAILTLTQNVTQQTEGLNVTYTNRVAAGACASLNNYLLVDTLPSNVTYVSGGTYNAATRVVSFNVSLAAGATQNYSFTVQINPNTYFPPATLINEQVTGTSIPAGFSATSNNAINWVVSNAQSHSAPSSLFAANQAVVSDMQLVTNTPVALGLSGNFFSFWHLYNTEEGWDGGVVEISTNNGTTWVDLGTTMTENPYNSLLGTGSALANRRAFSGSSNGWIKTSMNLSPYAGQNVRFRFRTASDNNTNETGWFVDDILVNSLAVVNMRSSLFNGAGTRVAVKDTFTLINQGVVVCTPVSITAQPVATSSCTGATATFSVTAAGSGPITYQWQVSADNCTTFTNIPGATSSTLTLTNVTAAMNGLSYKVVINNNCPSTASSNCAVLSVNQTAVVNTQPVSATVCAGLPASFAITATGSGIIYQWQVSTDGGTTFTNIAGANTATYNIAAATFAMNNNRYRVLLTSTCSATGITSNAATLTVNQPAVITASPVSVISCTGSTVNFNVSATGSGITYQWQVSMDGGTTFTNVAGATSATLTLTNLTVNQNGYVYRVIVNGVPCGGVTSANATLTIKPVPSVVLTAAQFNTITPATPTGVFATVSPNGSYLYRWTLNGAILPNITSANLPVTVSEPGEYQVTVFDPASGCSTVSNKVTVNNLVSGDLFIYPNPTSGVFQVRFYNSATGAQERILNIYDSKGARVEKALYTVNTGYDRMDVDLSRAAAGVYMVEVIENGKKLSSGRVIVQRN